MFSPLRRKRITHHKGGSWRIFDWAARVWNSPFFRPFNLFSGFTATNSGPSATGAGGFRVQQDLVFWPLHWSPICLNAKNLKQCTFSHIFCRDKSFVSRNYCMVLSPLQFYIFFQCWITRQEPNNIWHNMFAPNHLGLTYLEIPLSIVLLLLPNFSIFGLCSVALSHTLFGILGLLGRANNVFPEIIK